MCVDVPGFVVQVKEAPQASRAGGRRTISGQNVPVELKVRWRVLKAQKFWHSEEHHGGCEAILRRNSRQVE